MIINQGGGSLRGTRVLITGGRAPAALELARLLSAAGCEIHAADSIRHQLCGASRAAARRYEVPGPARDMEGFIAALEHIIERERIDWLIPTCEEAFYVSAGAERLGRLCTVFAAPLPQLRRLHSKWEFIRRAEALGFAVPHTQLVRSPEEWDAAYAALAQGRPAASLAQGYVAKPEFSRFAAKVHMVRPGGDRAQRLQQPDASGKAAGAGESHGAGRALSAGKRENHTMAGAAGMELIQAPLAADCYPWVIQQLVPGRSLCTYSIAHQGRLAAHAAYAATYHVHGGACVYFEPLFHPRATEWVRRFVELEQYTGQIAFDFIETDEGELLPIECNPRTTSGIHLFRPADGLASAILAADEAQGALLEPQPGTRRMLALPMLLYGIRSDRSWKGFGTWLRKSAAARDVVFRWTDARPAVKQALLLWELWRTAAAQGETVLEASTSDIEWNGGTR
ncbi:ATP-grasp domain-containing protein [Paenibacillus sp. y28]|uniref:ATP-grasp domain-containing protein n=1 Tax=Paenibacillus sp. y28 TaxID=3129110 RepID=UPI00301778FD